MRSILPQFQAVICCLELSLLLSLFLYFDSHLFEFLYCVLPQASSVEREPKVLPESLMRFSLAKIIYPVSLYSNFIFLKGLQKIILLASQLFNCDTKWVNARISSPNSLLTRNHWLAIIDLIQMLGNRQLLLS